MKQTPHLFGNRRSFGSSGFTFVKFILFLVIFACVVSAAWIYFLPHVLTSTLEKHTGFGVKVTELKLNPFTAEVELSGLVLTNPSSFPRREFMEVSSFSAKGHLATFFTGRPEFDYARVEVTYVALVRDADGVLNARLFSDRLQKHAAEQEPPVESIVTAKKQEGANDAHATTGAAVKPKVEPKADPKEAKSKAMAEPVAKGKNQKADKAAKEAKDEPASVEAPAPFYIKRLELKLDKLIVADYAGAKPEVRQYDCKLYYTFNDVTDPKQLVAPFALRSLQSVGVALRALIPGGIGRTMGAATQAPEPILSPGPASKETADPLKSVVEKLEETQKP